MIFDRIANILRYNIPQAAAIAAFLQEHDFRAPAVPELEIKGRELFVRPSAYRTKAPEDGQFESHQRYIDLQFVVSGAEIMETAPLEVLEILTPYDAAGDYQFFRASGDITRTLVRAGEFTIFFPGEAHRPCCSPENGANDVRKLVFKILAG